MSLGRPTSNTHVTRVSSHPSHPEKPTRSWSTLHFDVDTHLNPFFPPSCLPRFPHAVAHFLGYRNPVPPEAHSRPPLGNIPMIFWAVVGVFGSLALIGAVGQKISAFGEKGVPVIIGSFGAAAVLDFYAIESPLAQPRNAILGQILASITGIVVCKLFALLGPEEFERVRWLGGSLACGLSTAVMALTGTVHPPAGATALMAVVDDNVSGLGWYLLVPVSLGCGLMLVVALLVNNIQRRFPYYWWSPSETGLFWNPEARREQQRQQEEENRSRLEKPGDSATSSTDSEGGSGDEPDQVIIRRGEVIIPEGITLRPEEVLWLETISQRL
ncbi:HPP family-domain-containing protein [Triangularia verruculosa]|uniref:HPP family-domain-containing protein n=1 Tax=Triangularia verruculosa TaxID=2587418 RepID=A0AAN6X988_9PEZI|nr:HPP family-domain-containing protein [Triangularia verruculosa]